MKQTEVVKELGPQWKALSETQKAPYNKLAAADKVQLLSFLMHLMHKGRGLSFTAQLEKQKATIHQASVTMRNVCGERNPVLLHPMHS